MSTPEHILLSGIVGSHAYGLATQDSDVDRLGVFAAPTEEILSLHPPADSLVNVKPDITYHEARKYLSLALKCNPTVTELLWLEDYEVTSELGWELIGIRCSFLSASYVRNAYLGYATQQFRRLENRGDGSFSSDTRLRTAKHARHLLRLLDQGLQLYRDGHLTVRVDDPDLYHDFGRAVAAGDLDMARERLGHAESLFDEARTSIVERDRLLRAEEVQQRVLEQVVPPDLVDVGIGP